MARSQKAVLDLTHSFSLCSAPLRSAQHHQPGTKKRKRGVEKEVNAEIRHREEGKCML